MIDSNELESMVYKVFHNSEDGKKLLELLKESFLIEAPICQAGCESWWPYFRDGQNQMVRYFIACVDNVKNKLKNSNEEDEIDDGRNFKL